MKCPSFVAGEFFAGYILEDEYTDCLSEKCGHWDKVGKQCSEVTKAEELRRIREILQERRNV